MDYQDWTPVVLKRRSAKSAQGNGGDGSKERERPSNEKVRLSKIERMEYSDAPKKRLESSSVQALVRSRLDKKWNQEKADQICNFPKYTFKNIESNRILPTAQQQSIIQKYLDIQLKIVTL